MFKKFVTTVHPDGSVSTDRVRDAVSAEDVPRDKLSELGRIRKIAQEGRTRISSVEETMTTLVIIYVAGTVKVYHWVAE